MLRKKYRKPLYLSICIHTGRLLADIITVLHYYSLRIGFLKNQLYNFEASGGVYKNFRDIWYTRILRRIVSVLLRTPLRSKTLRFVDFSIPSINNGCIIVTCHTPWARLLINWCLEHDFGLIITGQHLIQRAPSINKLGKGFTELRHLIRHLRFGGRIIIIGDTFNNLGSCHAKYFEKNCKVSLLPTRLARITNVPLIAMVPILRKGSIHIYSGPRFDPDILNCDSYAVMQNILTFFEQEIRRNPSIGYTSVNEFLSKK